MRKQSIFWSMWWFLSPVYGFYIFFNHLICSNKVSFDHLTLKPDKVLGLPSNPRHPPLPKSFRTKVTKYFLPHWVWYADIQLTWAEYCDVLFTSLPLSTSPVTPWTCQGSQVCFWIKLISFTWPLNRKILGYTGQSWAFQGQLFFFFG